MLARILLPFAAALLLVADQPAQDAVKSELDKLQGNWTLVAEEIRGIKVPEQELAKSMVMVNGDQWTRTTDGKSQTVTIKIDPSKDPKVMDMTFVGPTGNESRWLGIYKLEGDTLTVCRIAGIFERPNEFKTTADAGLLFVWKRAGK